MSQKYSVQVIEGEMDEDEEEINQQVVSETLSNKQAPSPQQEDQIIKNPTVEDLKTIKEIKEYLVEHRKGDVEKLEQKSDGLIKEQSELLGEIEKTKLGFYNTEFVEIQETFMMLPEYVRKVQEIQRIMNKFKSVVQKEQQNQTK